MTSKKLVSIFAKDKTVSSFDFWKMLNTLRKEDGATAIRHDDFLVRVAREIDDLGVCDKFAHPQNKTTMTCYQLNKDQMLLIGMRESRVIRKQVLKWLHDLSAKVDQLESRKIDRAMSSLNYINQNKMLKQVRESEGKETPPYHYSNEANLINRIIIGVSAAKYRKDNDFDANENLRDTLTTIQLESIASLESHNTSLIAAGIDYATRKKMLNKIFMRDFSDKLISEDIRINA
jgi:hypothetical protein